MRKAHLVTLAFIFAVVVAGSARIVAQQTAAVLLTPVSGIANNGLAFAGTFMIRRFEARNNGAVAFGSVTGQMTTADGVTRNVVTQLAVPMAISAGTATAAATPGVTPTTCGGVHLELAPAAFQVLGSRVSINRNALDITTAQPDTGAITTQTTGFGAATGLASIGVAAPTNIPSTNVSFTNVAPTSPANTTAPATTSVVGPLGQPVSIPSSLASSGTLNPGVATPVQNTPASPVGSSPQFEQLVCSAGALSQTASNSAQVVQLLNQMLTTMGG